MPKNILITPEGTKDYLFEEVFARKKVTDILSNLFINNGYAQVETAGLEFLDVYRVSGGCLPVERMYKLVDAKGRLLVVRPDSTLPIARLLATRLKNITTPIRLFYTQSICSVNPSMRGRKDEILQTGIELIAPMSLKSDLEALYLSINTLKNIAPHNFSIELGHVGIFSALTADLNLDEEQEETIRVLIETKNYSALNDVLDELDTPELVAPLKQLPRLFGDANVFEKAANLLASSPAALDILAYLKRLYEGIKAMNICDNIMIDLGTVNKNKYYTGIVFNGYISGSGDAVLSGGRYDNLLQEYGRDGNAIGFAVNVDAVAKYYVDSYKKVIPTYIVYADEVHLPDAISYITEKTNNGIICELSLFDSLEQSLTYAKDLGIQHVVNVSTVIEELEVC